MECRTIALTMVALVLLTACPEPPNGEDPGNGPVKPEPTRVEVEATVNEDGAVEIIKEDHEGRHEAAIVHPGQRVEWACRCAPELEFTVADLRPFVDLELLTDYKIMQALEVAMKGDSEAEAEERLEALDTLAPAFFKAPRGQFHAEQYTEGDRDVTGGWSSGVEEDDYTDGTFVSPEVPDVVGLVLWKFTWRVRQKGHTSECGANDPGCDEWDPHILMAPHDAI